jgi:transcription antitermination factor NusB
LLNRIVEGVIENMPAIEETVKGSLSEKWKLERMSILLTSILECAVFEMLYSLPHKKIVIINEYVNLSKRFFEESEIGFVNAFLAGLINTQPGAGQIQEDE